MFVYFQTIFLPGDNDIGGEDELIFFPNVKRFENYFDKKPIVERYQNIEFYKVMQYLIPSLYFNF